MVKFYAFVRLFINSCINKVKGPLEYESQNMLWEIAFSEPVQKAEISVAQAGKGFMYEVEIC